MKQNSLSVQKNKNNFSLNIFIILAQTIYLNW